MADTTTANYHWVMPELGGSDDTWGEKLNATIAAIDAQVKATMDTALAAAGVVAGDVLAALLLVDGAGSGVDADLLDGQHGAYYLPAASYTAADVLTKIKTVDGASSGLDADFLDGKNSTDFVLAADLAAAYQPKDSDLTAIAALSTQAYGRGLLQLANQAALQAAVGIVSDISASQLTGSGYIKFSNGFFIIWGSLTAAAEGATSYNYSTSGVSGLTTFSRAVVSGARNTIDDDMNYPGVTAATTTGFTVWNTNHAPITCQFIAVGK